MRTIHVGLIGDCDESVTAHGAIPLALRLAAEPLGISVEPVWLATALMPEADRLARFDALWCVPGSPYRDLDGALRGIRFARERGLPFLGTCGGFQHAVIDAVIEYARNRLGMRDAEHAETSPHAPNPVITALACSLVEVTDEVTLAAGSRIAAAYGTQVTREGYHCNYGLNPAFGARLQAGPLRPTAHDGRGEVRAVELEAHPFFVCTLFQPERAALRGKTPPLVTALLRAAMH